MTLALYQLRLWNSTRTVLKSPSLPHKGFDYLAVVNDIGVLNIALPVIWFDTIADEDIIEIYRSIDGAPYYLALDKFWLVKNISLNLDENGVETLNIQAFCSNYLLATRIIAYASGTSQSSKNTATPADNLIKAFVREQLTTASVSARNITLTVEADASKAPNSTKAAAWRDLLPTLKEIAADSLTNGTYLAFDVIRNGSTVEFRTFTGQRGQDRSQTSSKPLILDSKLGTLKDCHLVFDYAEQATYIYCGGQGEGADRVVKEASDASRIAHGPYARIEKFIDARSADDPASIQPEANSALRQAKPKITFNGAIRETSQIKFDYSYTFGDKLTATYRGYTLNVWLEKIQVKVSEKGQETIDARLYYYG